MFFCHLIVAKTPLQGRKETLVFAARSKTEANTVKVEENPVAVGGVEEGDDEEDEWEYQDENDIYLRSKFFESWLWRTVDLPAQADRDG